MRKRNSSETSEQTEQQVQNKDLPTSSSEPSGLNRLKFAGIGAPRQRKGKGDEAKEQTQIVEGRKKLSGEDITSLGSLEAELMGILWDIAKPAASMDVMEQSLYKRRAQGQEPVSFATVATTLRRLTDKGVVSTYKNAQGTPVYSPTVAREEMAARILNNVSQTLLGQSLHGLLPRLLGTLTPGRGKSKANTSAEASGEEQAEVERLMQALENAAGKNGENKDKAE